LHPRVSAEIQRIADTLSDTDEALYGVTSIGEFASSPQGMLEFFNETVVVASVQGDG